MRKQYRNVHIYLHKLPHTSIRNIQVESQQETKKHCLGVSTMLFTTAVISTTRFFTGVGVIYKTFNYWVLSTIRFTAGVLSTIRFTTGCYLQVTTFTTRVYLQCVSLLGCYLQVV